jgi:hypothetical protein
MTRFTLAIAAVLAFAATLPAVSANAAARDRVFVASYGNDTNPCTFGSPCKTFQVAIDAVATNGEVTAIDSAGFGPIVINKFVTITSPAGVEAGIQAVSGGNAITVNPSTSVTVTLHGLTLEGSGVGQNGIVLTATAPGTLNIVDCVVSGFTGTGILATPAFTGQVVMLGNILITDSFVQNNGSSGIKIASQNASTRLQFAIDRTVVTNNGTSGNDGGIVIDSGSGQHTGTISSVVANMNFVGLNFTGNSFSAFTFVSNSTLENSRSSTEANADFNLPANAEMVYLMDSNRIESLISQGTIFSDGTNDILFPNGISPTEFARK